MKRGQSNGRPLAVKVRTAKGRKISSTRWLQRQLNDPYVHQARLKGYKSRAAFKLLQINEKFNIFKPGMTVIDLGCSPGGWSQVALEKVSKTKSNGVLNETGRVIGIDLNEPEVIAGLEFHKIDFMEIDTKILAQTLDVKEVDGLKVGLTIDNITDQVHREAFQGAIMGRWASVKLGYDF